MLNQNNKIKIALIGDSLSKGGAEKVHAILSIYLEKQGLDVHNCIFVDAVSYEFSGSLLNIGKIKVNSSSIIRKIYRFRALQKWVAFNQFDCLIDFRMRPSFFLEFILSQIIYPKNTMYTVHSGVLEFYFPKNIFLSKLIYYNQKIIAVSNAVQNEIRERYLLKNVKTIYNPIDFERITYSKDFEIVEGSYVLAVGTMDNSIKQFDKLIMAYSKSELPKQNIKMILLGDGKNLIKYQKLAEGLNLSKLVLFLGVVQNPFPYYKNAIYSVLSSKNEGFPNAILESLACKTPVVTFDCFTGPSEIITSYLNGILVENQNFDELVDAMNLMISDKELYRQCKDNSSKTVEKFSVEIIGKKWLEIIVS